MRFGVHVSKAGGLAERYKMQLTLSVILFKCSPVVREVLDRASSMKMSLWLSGKVLPNQT